MDDLTIHTSLYMTLGPWLLDHVVDPWASLWCLGWGLLRPSPWKQHTITNTYSETYMHINKWRATHWCYTIDATNTILQPSQVFPLLCRIMSSSWQRTHQHWFTTTIHLQTAMQTLTTSNAFTDKQQSAMHYRQYKQTLQASATHKLMVIHTEPAQWDWWEHVSN